MQGWHHGNKAGLLRPILRLSTQVTLKAEATMKDNTITGLYYHGFPEELHSQSGWAYNWLNCLLQSKTEF